MVGVNFEFTIIVLSMDDQKLRYCGGAVPRKTCGPFIALLVQFKHITPAKIALIKRCSWYGIGKDCKEWSKTVRGFYW